MSNTPISAAILPHLRWHDVENAQQVSLVTPFPGLGYVFARLERTTEEFAESDFKAPLVVRVPASLEGSDSNPLVFQPLQRSGSGRYRSPPLGVAPQSYLGQEKLVEVQVTSCRRGSQSLPDSVDYLHRTGIEMEGVIIVHRCRGFRVIHAGMYFAAFKTLDDGGDEVPMFEKWSDQDNLWESDVGRNKSGFHLTSYDRSNFDGQSFMQLPPQQQTWKKFVPLEESSGLGNQRQLILTMGLLVHYEKDSRPFQDKVVCRQILLTRGGNQPAPQRHPQIPLH
ncbi:hypothetical protein T439DRAFT_321431 [Meredithblackwellia eburnea MCA 4105]